MGLLCVEKLTISPVCLSQALYTQPQVPSPSSFKILYLEIKTAALEAQEKETGDPMHYKVKQVTNRSIITGAAEDNQKIFNVIQSSSKRRCLHCWQNSVCN